MSVEKHPYEFKLVRAGLIAIDKRYQREKQTSMIKEIVNNFDYHQVNCVKVIFRDGMYYAFDGQQTTCGLLQKFGENYPVPCLIYYDVPSWVDEAKLFENANVPKARKTVGVRDLWNSRISREDETTMEIKEIIERHNMTICTKHSGSSISGRILALNALERSYKKLGKNKFDEMFDILDRAWHGAPESITSPMISGMTEFINTYYGDYKKNRLIDKLSSPTTLGTIISGGSSGKKSGAKKYAAEIVSIYNSYIAKDSPTYLDPKKI